MAHVVYKIKKGPKKEKNKSEKEKDKNQVCFFFILLFKYKILPLIFQGMELA
jgi:hypothetical protein